MPRRLSHLKHSLPLALACVVLTSCAVGQTPGQAGPGGQISAAANPGATPRAQRALELGLAPADSYVNETQVQIKDANGSPIKGATVVIGDMRLTSDDLGVVSLPPELLKEGTETLMASVEVVGHVGVTAGLLPGAAIKLAAIDSARTTVSAAGGVARNAAGNMEVVFAPGALTGEGSVAVTRTYSEKIQAGTPLPSKIMFADDYGSDKLMEVDAKYLPVLGQYKYNLDLGGAQLAPGSSYTVRFKVEGPMKDVLDARIKAGDDLKTLPDLVSVDSNGDIWVAMMVAGPTAAPAIAANLFKLQAGCTDYQEVEADLPSNQRGQTACIENWDAGYRNAWLAGGNRIGVAGIMTHDGRFNGGGCVYYDYDPNLYVCRSGGYQGGWWADRRDKIMRRWYSATINAAVSYQSDDSRIANQAIPGARVNFNHATTPTKPGSLSPSSDGNGLASAWGLQNSNGSASATLPSEPYTYGRNATYVVDCRTVALKIVKNKPRVQLQTNLSGAAVGGSLNYPTNLGTYTAGVSSPSLAPTIDLGSATSAFRVYGSFQPDNATWVEAESGQINIGWNNSASLPTNVWFSKGVSTTVTYASNDNTVPADMQPAIKWAGQVANGSNVSFAHAVSGGASKPANRDALSFTNVNAASTWGLNGAAGTVSATRSANSLTLRGAASYTINGGAAPVAINANLPEVLLRINGRSNGEAWTMSYALIGPSGASETKTMQLPAPDAAGLIHVFLPVNEAVGNPNSYGFQVVNIYNGDFSVALPNGSREFPTLSGLYRGTSTAYATLGSEFVTPK